MIRIALVEDRDADAERLSSHLERFGRENGEAFSIVRFTNPISFLEPYTADYDLVIMDIQMPHMNGMEAAYRLREMDEDVLLMFVTSMTQYAIEGYEVKASNYIVKPVSYPDFALKMKKLFRSKINRGDAIVLKTDMGQIRIAPDKIRYLESVGHNVIYHTLQGDYSQFQSLTNAAAPLEEKGFCRINSCYVVNLAFVKSIRGYDAILDEGTLKISQPRKKAVARAFSQFDLKKEQSGNNPSSN